MDLPAKIHGIFAAALTPMDADFQPELEAVPQLLDFLARRGCHGALLLGTTGEGPSFAAGERVEIFKAALEVRQMHPDFRLLGGTGTPSLEETIWLTRAAFDTGLDGVVVLPPYYYRKASEDGLFTWFSLVIRKAVPPGGALLGYHIPPVSGVPLPVDLLSRLKDVFPDRFAGIKDSSGDAALASELGNRFGKDLTVMTGNDRLLTHALSSNASGSITAMSNLFSPDLRQVFDTFITGKPDATAQSRLDTFRSVMDRFPPAPPLLKALLHRLHGFPLWTVRPPLMPSLDSDIQEALEGVIQAV
jgi:4-hydroxy-tetrahydrodipicolinate synthase